MVTTRHSNAYTNYALSSLVEHTKFEPDDEVILIDNDNSYSGLPEECRSRVKIRINERPHSFAANLNQTLDLARERQGDVVFLNNDLILSPNWFEPLRVQGNALLSPLSNAEVPYSEGALHCKLGMDLQDYLGNEQAFRNIIRRHRNRSHGTMKMLTFAFFAVKLPYSVYSVVGPFDESFGIGGGEDKDYCIRCYQQGFELRFALNSYILHFQGKSTWRGAETPAETAARNLAYIGRFKEKWGDALFQVLIMNDLDLLTPDLQEAYKRGEFPRLIEQLLSKEN
jgi:GT2 family glycosyltransferase